MMRHTHVFPFGVVFDKIRVVITRHGLFLSFILLLPLSAHAAGKTGASFLRLPSGGAPTAMGSAYTALATDAHAPLWNPAGLAFLESHQLTVQHMDYITTVQNNQLSVALQPGWGLSLIQVGAGQETATDLNGNSIGEHSAAQGAYGLSGALRLNDQLSLGLTGKYIAVKLDDVSDGVFAADTGALWRVSPQVDVGATVMNLGQSLTFLSEDTALPTAFNLGMAWRPLAFGVVSTDLVFPRNEDVALHIGTEWRPFSVLSLRAGYRTETSEGLSGGAGFSGGVGFLLRGQELSYAWVPAGDLGNAHTFSFLLKWGGS